MQIFSTSLPSYLSSIRYNCNNLSRGESISGHIEYNTGMAHVDCGAYNKICISITKLIFKAPQSKLKIIQIRNLALLPQHCFSDLQAKGFTQGWWHSIPNLAVLVPDGARKIEVIPEIIRFKVLVY